MIRPRRPEPGAIEAELVARLNAVDISSSSRGKYAEAEVWLADALGVESVGIAGTAAWRRQPHRLKEKRPDAKPLLVARALSTDSREGQLDATVAVRRRYFEDDLDVVAIIEDGIGVVELVCGEAGPTRPVAAAFPGAVTTRLFADIEDQVDADRGNRLRRWHPDATTGRLFFTRWDKNSDSAYMDIDGRQYAYLNDHSTRLDVGDLVVCVRKSTSAAEDAGRVIGIGKVGLRAQRSIEGEGAGVSTGFVACFDRFLRAADPVDWANLAPDYASSFRQTSIVEVDDRYGDLAERILDELGVRDLADVPEIQISFEEHGFFDSSENGQTPPADPDNSAETAGNYLDRRVVCVYVPATGQVNFGVGLDAGTWGFRDARDDLDDLVVGDFVVLASGGSPRVPAEQWRTQTLGRVILGRITQTRYLATEPLWPNERDGVVYRDRFGFEVIEDLVSVELDGPLLEDEVVEAVRRSGIDRGRGYVTRAEGLLFERAEETTMTTPLPTFGAPADPPLSMEWLAAQTLLPEAEVAEIVSTLQERTSQIVLAGPPGTGKTWVAERIAEFLTQRRSGAVTTLQFHPTYSYEDFVEGIRPVAGADGIHFDTVAGPLVRLADAARRVDHPVVLVVDEMNRANLPAVFGELLYLLEYRGAENRIHLLHRSDFWLPSNLYLIATMNTADRSIRSIDTALRRRFDLFEFAPNPTVIDNYYARDDVTSPAVEDLAAGMEKLNDRLAEYLDRHHAIGHTFFMRPGFDRRELERTWSRQIHPLIEEYFFDQPDVVEEFRLGDFWASPER